jgi:hypothetical protein
VSAVTPRVTPPISADGRQLPERAEGGAGGVAVFVEGRGGQRCVATIAVLRF